MNWVNLLIFCGKIVMPFPSCEMNEDERHDELPSHHLRRYINPLIKGSSSTATFVRFRHTHTHTPNQIPSCPRRTINRRSVSSSSPPPKNQTKMRSHNTSTHVYVKVGLLQIMED
mmetsp:Transcript_34717/g.83883  ORF Transcript_34717/g.83883 Transcript_34717/m.83883 type:complete len:115 (+) Transcript_34717:846-1190(+)